MSDEERLDRLIAAEQDERRRIALFLHDGPVQNLSGIALMLDATLHAIQTGKLEDAQTVLQSALDRQRVTIRELRDLSFALEPVVLRDQGFGPALHALAEQLGTANQIRIDLDIDEAERLGETAQVALYTIIRELIDQSVRRVLELKVRSGVTANRFVSLEALRQVVGVQPHRDMAAQIAHPPLQEIGAGGGFAADHPAYAGRADQRDLSGRIGQDG